MQQEEEVKGGEERRRIKVVGKRKEGWNESTREGQEWGGQRNDRISQHESEGDRNARSMVEWIYTRGERISEGIHAGLSHRR